MPGSAERVQRARAGLPLVLDGWLELEQQAVAILAPLLAQATCLRWSDDGA
ncbi:MAG: hypothetical protein M0T77_05345 [Actinomycetota bacterium]|nr:hypothetical protein [Actinomycetota bacterium]